MPSTTNQPLTSAIPQPDRRLHPRYSVRVQAELYREGSDIPVRTETTDLGQGGCYVRLSQTLTPGNYVDGNFWLDGQQVRFRGRVVTRHPQFGNGIMFLELDGNGEHLLERYLQAIAL